MKYLTGIYNGLLWSLVITTFCFNDLWLQMRVNTGYIFMACFIVLSFILILIQQRRLLGSKFSIINLVICSVIEIFTAGIQGIKVVPAAFIREGLHINALTFGSINLVLGSLLIIGLIVVISMNH